MPTWRRRASGSSVSRGRPRNRISPSLGTSRRLSSRSSIDLPAPDGPTTTVIPMPPTVRSMWSRTVLSPSRRLTPASWNSGGPGSGAAATSARRAGGVVLHAVAADRGGLDARTGRRGIAQRGAHPLAGAGELQDAVDGPHAIAPADLLALGVGAAVVADPQLVDPPVAPGHLGGDLGLEPEPVLLDDHRLDHLAPEGLVAGLHVGEVQVGEHVGQRGEEPVA